MSQFTETVQGINAGETELELSLKFKALVDAVRETGKKGSLTLKLTVEQNKRDRRLYELTAEVKTTVPQQPPQAAAYFMPDGYDTLVPLGHDPRQLALDMGGNQQGRAGEIEMNLDMRARVEAQHRDDLPERYEDADITEVIR